MNDTSDYTTPIVESILHPTDFSEGSRVAFYHALKAALLAKSKLTLLHVSPGTALEWADFPGVRETLERWGLLPADSPRSAVPELGIDVRKVIAKQSDPVKTVLRYLGDHPADLIVLATHQHEGRAHWLRHSVAEPVARRAAQMTLFIPGDSAGFVSAEDGSVSLEHILIPVAATPRPQPAIEAAARLVARLNCPRGTFTLLHVGDPDGMPTVRCPDVPGWEWNKNHAHRRRDSRNPGHGSEIRRESDHDDHRRSQRVSRRAARQPQRAGVAGRARASARRARRFACRSASRLNDTRARKIRIVGVLRAARTKRAVEPGNPSPRVPQPGLAVLGSRILRLGLEKLA